MRVASKANITGTSVEAISTGSNAAGSIILNEVVGLARCALSRRGTFQTIGHAF